jgi:hypothetical protein
VWSRPASASRRFFASNPPSQPAPGIAASSDEGGRADVGREGRRVEDFFSDILLELVDRSLSLFSRSQPDSSCACRCFPSEHLGSLPRAPPLARRRPSSPAAQTPPESLSRMAETSVPGFVVALDANNLAAQFEQYVRATSAAASRASRACAETVRFHPSD